VLLALNVSSANPRVGRSGNLLLALFAFVIYYNMLNIGQSWISSGRFSMAGFMVMLHGSVLVLNLAWLSVRQNNWGLRTRRTRAPAALTPKIEPTT
jgi:lipopolysaccharide export system permease protein